jgi:hypothetical protein
MVAGAPRRNLLVLLLYLYLVALLLGVFTLLAHAT